MPRANFGAPFTHFVAPRSVSMGRLWPISEHLSHASLPYDVTATGRLGPMSEHPAYASWPHYGPPR
eukprot:3215884-Pyramimonas_sp.AAC.1